MTSCGRYIPWYCLALDQCVQVTYYSILVGRYSAFVIYNFLCIFPPGYATQSSGSPSYFFDQTSASFGLSCRFAAMWWFRCNCVWVGELIGGSILHNWNRRLWHHRSVVENTDLSVHVCESKAARLHVLLHAFVCLHYNRYLADVV